ncbi:hypothetical protein [Microbacterium xylanilyticum]
MATTPEQRAAVREALIAAGVLDAEPTTRAEAKQRATQTPNRWIPSPDARRWLYGVLVALAGVGVGYGIITAEQGGLWLSLGSAVLGTGPLIAGRNVPRD